MADVSEASDRLYVISEHEPRQLALVSAPDSDGAMAGYGIRAHNPLGTQWRTVYEPVLDAKLLAELLSSIDYKREPDLEVDGYRFWFNGNPGAVLPASATRLGRN
jgi:hypothetical protein